MGIKSINTLLKKLCPEAFVKVKPNFFKDKKIAIDGDNFSAKFMAGSNSSVVKTSNIPYDDLDYNMCEKLWFSRWRNMINKLLMSKIVPVIVFDGTSPKEKLKTKEKRTERMKKDREKYDQLVADIDNLNPLEEASLEKVKELKKIASRLFYIRSESKRKLIKYFDINGIPYAFAKGEGERLCSMLVRDGYVETALSKDTDLMAYGTNMSATDVVMNNDGVMYFECVMLSKVTEDLGITFKQFLDLCIMCGCDYNSNIRGIGPHNSLKLIKRYGSVEGIENLDIECLNYAKCKELFRYMKASDLIVSDMETISYKNLGNINPRTDPANLSLKQTDANSQCYFKSEEKDYLISVPPVTKKFERKEKWEYHVYNNRVSNATMNRMLDIIETTKTTKTTT